MWPPTIYFPEADIPVSPSLLDTKPQIQMPIGVLLNTYARVHSAKGIYGRHVEQSAGMVVPGWGRKVGPGEAPWGLEVQAPLQKQTKTCCPPLPDVFRVRKAPLSAQAHCTWLFREGMAWGPAVEVPASRVMRASLLAPATRRA